MHCNLLEVSPIVSPRPSSLQWAIVGRYRRRSDAEGHLLLFRQRVPNIRFEVVFDLPRPQG
ncbi:MAG: hypothetical protein JGK17_14695 [Microcoleus sp. PH2017_10_PVI_O_A]|nr:hypothetical protein [Microcoleus sp. PH2017_10_PVI_O_A]MCC3460943.1 hypothetical protein [Microcoleus sp. PH2017_11_PCY_U_A]MCC3479465.1 hypothetical protein [Microcoleus sp. PH2017_12_PCY_D_A]MCC3560307.1 hypothetical protein [Microcoleus sp. PH2017_27_LUM_O_A]TAE82286.1 MAG: hypothetical protein EAZ83_12640 [Oscillatoriales cyanobacterium]